MTFPLVQQIETENLKQRTVNQLIYFVIHRSGPWPKKYGQPKTAQDLRDIFADKSLGTNGKMPYSFVYNPDRRIVYQAHYVTTVTPHAKSQNVSGLGIAILRDLRSEALNLQEYSTFVKFLAYLKFSINPKQTFIVKGHTDLPDSTSDPNKECPGQLLDCAQLDYDSTLVKEAIYQI